MHLDEDELLQLEIAPTFQRFDVQQIKNESMFSSVRFVYFWDYQIDVEKCGEIQS